MSILRVSCLFLYYELWQDVLSPFRPLFSSCGKWRVLSLDFFGWLIFWERMALLPWVRFSLQTACLTARHHGYGRRQTPPTPSYRALSQPPFSLSQRSLSCLPKKCIDNLLFSRFLVFTAFWPAREQAGSTTVDDREHENFKRHLPFFQQGVFVFVSLSPLIDTSSPPLLFR